MPHLDSVPLKTLILGLTSSAPKFVYTSVILLSLSFRYLQTHMKKSCMYLSSQLFCKTSHKTLSNFKKNPRKLHFSRIAYLNFKNIFFQCLPCGHSTETLNLASSKETESLGKNNSRQKYLDKSLCIPFKKGGINFLYFGKGGIRLKGGLPRKRGDYLL